jgi:hypothetical protein
MDLRHSELTLVIRYDDPRGKMLGLLSDKDTMAGHSEEEACKDLVEFAKGKKGHFKYVPNGEYTMSLRGYSLADPSVIKAALESKRAFPSSSREVSLKEGSPQRSLLRSHRPTPRSWQVRAQT